MKTPALLFLSIFILGFNLQSRAQKEYKINSPIENSKRAGANDYVKFYGPLFLEIQRNHIFADQKTFVDAEPKSNPDSIISNYNKLKTLPGFNLKEFVLNNFEITGRDTSSMIDHLNYLWNDLTRHAKKQDPYSTLLSLPYKYIIPGGRFREIFYWDSYFTMLGLEVSKRNDLIEGMIRNFAYFIDTYGHIPNGSRTYFLSRSQPPFFAMMVDLLAESKKDDQVLVEFLPQMIKEHHYWMTADRNINLGENEIMTHYWDELETPRPEAWTHSEKFFAESDRDSSYFRDERAACESGWDFSSRWFSDSKHMKTLNTTDLIQVDLNCLLSEMERVISKAAAIAGKTDISKEYSKQSETRARLIRKYCWDSATHYFYDYNFKLKKLSEHKTLAGVYPLYLNIASKDQAEGVENVLKKDFLYPGGMVTTLNQTGEQWDFPNAWAPLQWATYKGLRNYGFDDMAYDLASRWTELNIKVYIGTGKMMEKYNVVDLNKPGGGGEYEAQDGFGWTNGVFLRMWSDLNNR